MDTKANAYAVLELCEEDPDYSNWSLDTDISRHIRSHMGITDWPTWQPLCDHIGFDREQGSLLWALLNEEDWAKERVLYVFAKMVEDVHGPNGAVPKSRRIL